MSTSVHQNQAQWLAGASCQSSPNFNARPDPADISLLVIHNISLPAGEFATGYIDQLFCNTLDCHSHPSFESLRGVEVSAHFLIRRCGELVQFVALDQRAWHAGLSSFGGRDNCNDFSLGVELEGTDHQAYTEQQYQTLVQLTSELQERYPMITAERIVGHCDIAPGRKTDPGAAFDWLSFRQRLNSAYQSAHSSAHKGVPQK